MKKFSILLINFYQTIISPVVKQLLGVKSSCRFSPTCSEYAKRSILNKGFAKGSFLAFSRLLKCQPFYNAN